MLKNNIVSHLKNINFKQCTLKSNTIVKLKNYNKQKSVKKNLS
jgi:hypothetical protein